MRGLILIAVLALAGCTGGVKDAADMPAGSLVVSDGAGGATLIPVEVQGVRCIVGIGAYKGMLSCNWSTP